MHSFNCCRNSSSKMIFTNFRIQLEKILGKSASTLSPIHILPIGKNLLRMNFRMKSIYMYRLGGCQTLVSEALNQAATNQRRLFSPLSRSSSANWVQAKIFRWQHFLCYEMKTILPVSQVEVMRINLSRKHLEVPVIKSKTVYKVCCILQVWVCQTSYLESVYSLRIKPVV